MKINQLFCTHKESVKSRDGKRLFLRCLKCGRESEGVQVGGFKYHEDVYLRLERSKSAVAGL